jgi:hypothetical protein
MTTVRRRRIDGREGGEAAGVLKRSTTKDTEVTEKRSRDDDGRPSATSVSSVSSVV